MKKVLFWFLTDVVWFVLYIIVMYLIMINLLHYYKYSLNLTNDGLVIVIFEYAKFLIINFAFVIIQNVGSFFFMKENKCTISRYLKFKKVVFIVHAISLYIFNLSIEIYRLILGDYESFIWLFILLLCPIISVIIYNYIIRYLGERIKWEN